MTVARVVPDVTGIDRQFDYLVPDEIRDQVRVGTQVRVPLSGRRVGGWVVAIDQPDPTLDAGRLLPIAKVSGIGPSARIVGLAEWASVRWAGRLRPVLVAASPPGVVLALPPVNRGAAVPEPVHPLAASLLGRGGGLMRLPPAADSLPVVLAACRLGPVLVITPSVSDARLAAARLRRAGRTVALMPTDWAAAAAGVDVVIGARGAAFAPCARLSSVVVLDEHDEALQEERQPTWNARDVAVERAEREGVPWLLVSPCPSVAAIVRAGPQRRVKPSVATERAGWPIVEIVDRSDDEPWQKSLATSALIRQLRDHDRRVVCVLNSVGRARLLACRRCRGLQRCEHCEAAVHQRDDEHFECARCATVRPPVCQACGASSFAALRIGVSRLRDELEKAAGRAVVLIAGRDTDIEPLTEAGVYVGTEAALHRVRHCDTVAFVDFDAELLAPRYRATEQAMTLLARAARLTGGRERGGRILVQTFLPKHEVLDAALHADPGRLTDKELARRRALGLPPFAAIATVSGAGTDEYVAAVARAGLEVAPMLTGTVLVRAPDWDALGAVLAATPRPTPNQLRIEVDPARL